MNNTLHFDTVFSTFLLCALNFSFIALPMKKEKKVVPYSTSFITVHRREFAPPSGITEKSKENIYFSADRSMKSITYTIIDKSEEIVTGKTITFCVPQATTTGSLSREINILESTLSHNSLLTKLTRPIIQPTSHILEKMKL